MEMQSLPTGNGKGKSVLAQNEKIVSWIGAAGITAALVWIGVKVLPYVITAITNALILGGILAATGLVLWLIWANKDMISLRYQLLIKNMWRSIVKSDPVSVMEVLWRKWTGKRSLLNDTIVEMKSAESVILTAMDKKESDAKTNFAQAKKAQELMAKRNDPNYGRTANKSSIIANRLLVSNQNLVPRLKQIQTAIAYCTKLYDRWGDDLELLKQDIDLSREDLKLLSTTSSAFDSAKSILNDNPDERALWEMAKEAQAEKLSGYVANITRFTEQAKDWVYNKDIQEAVWEDDGAKLLSMYDQDTFNQLTDFRSLLTKDGENNNFGTLSNDYQKVLAQPLPSTSSSGTFKDLV